VPQLGGQEAENRFNYVFINFLLSVATKMHPLVLFIDDLQWIDAASLRLLKVIKSDFNQSGLLVIGAYRDNEVNASHPLMEIIGDGEKKGMLLRILKLENLQQHHLEKLLSDTLRSREGIKGLGENIYKKTQGNPFFTRRLLSSLNEEGHIRYEFGLNSWKWDIGTLNKEVIAENVADLLAKSIAQLPDETIDILKLAACIGNRFDVQTLAMISGFAEQAVVKLLTVSLSGQYVFESGDTFEFVHDQVQQAGYALIAEEERPRVHLEIGRLLFSRAVGDELEEALFDIVHHFNASASLLESESEKLTIAELDLKAARKTKSAAAYAEGFAYVVNGLALLDTDSWQHHYDLTLALHNEAAELSYLTGHYDRVDEFEALIHKNARSILDRTHVFYLRTMIDTDQGRLLESIETGIGALAELGITIPREPSTEEIERAEAEFTEALATRSIEELAYLPEMTDKSTLVAMEIMAPVLLNAYIASPQHLSLLTYRGASLSLQHGNGPWSPFFYSGVVVLWGGAVDNSPTGESAQGLEAAHKLAMVLLKLLENPKYARCKAKSLDGMLGSMNWHTPMRQLLDLSLEMHQAGLDTGDLLFAGLGIFHLANFGVASGINLNEHTKTVSAYREIVKNLGQDFAYRITGIGLQTAQNLMTPSSEPDVLEEQHFDERQWLPDAVAANDGLTLFLVFQAKLLLSYHFDRHDRLMEYAAEAEKYLDSVYAMINIGFFRFYDSLSRLRLYSSLSADEGELALKRVESNQLRMRIWAQSGPMTFQHKFDLVAAEMARVSGNIGLAMENYERAIEGAGDNAFIHEEALANELYARFWQERGNDMIAEMYMREARALYHQWGAEAKVSHLENRYPQWFKTRTISNGQSDTPGTKVRTTITQPITPIQIELEGIISASQTLSSETDLDQLLKKMLELVMAGSGAAKAVLLIRLENDWFARAQGDIASEQYDILLNRPFDPADREADFIPELIFNYCLRAKEVLVLGDARQDHRFAKDRMIQTHNIKSLACIPTLHQGELKAMVYLENRQLADVFTLERLEILKHLSSQFSISMENALLYDSLKQKVSELRESDERYDLAISGSAAGIWDWDILSDKVFYSDRYKQLLGYASEEFRDTPDEVWNRLHPDDYESVRLAVDQHLEERVPFRIDYRLRTRSGEYRWYYARGQALWDERGQATRMSGSITDITQRKQAEIGLREAYTEIEQLKNQLEAESAYLQDEIKLEHNFKNIIGQSEALKYVLHRVEQVAPTESPVLIMGETGTGKELMARALHELSHHGKRALVKVNCAALPGNLIESELFGREKGAFTGATTTQVGRFELAKGSTLFLDEIGELPLELQSKLLRVLESGEFERLGSSRTLHSDARIIAATNRVLDEEVRKGRFRQDLWYRLKVFPITVPPLREHPEDIPLLVKWFVDQLARKMGKRVAEIPKRTMQMLQSYPWPGNVRELKHAVESALITAKGKKLNFELPQMADTALSDFKSFEQMERDYILRVLKAKNWKVGGDNSAASTLGMHVNTLRGRMKKLGIKKPTRQ